MIQYYGILRCNILDIVCGPYTLLYDALTSLIVQHDSISCVKTEYILTLWPETERLVHSLGHAHGVVSVTVSVAEGGRYDHVPDRVRA